MIPIDTVYQRVLAIANKEQRGYITPQEFNLIANQAQFDIFEQYFYEMNAQERAEEPMQHGSFGDMTNLLDDKIGVFKSMQLMTHQATVNDSGWGVPGGHYRYGQVFYQNKQPKVVDAQEIENIQRSRWHNDELGREPVMYKLSDRWMIFDENGEVTGGGVSVEAVTRPNIARWGYIVVNEQALYNANTSVNFELHEADETDLVIKILELAGMVINKPQLAAFAGQEEGGNAAEENK